MLFVHGLQSFVPIFRLEDGVLRLAKYLVGLYDLPSGAIKYTGQLESGQSYVVVFRVFAVGVALMEVQY